MSTQGCSESSQVSPTDSAARSTNDTNVDIVKPDRDIYLLSQNVFCTINKLV